MRSHYSIKDSLLLNTLSLFADCFNTMACSKDQLKMCWPQVCRFLTSFLNDKELVEMCLIDLHNTNANSQETDHESDSDKGSSIYAESEEIRLKTIRILNALLSLELTDE